MHKRQQNDLFRLNKYQKIPSNSDRFFQHIVGKIGFSFFQNRLTSTKIIEKKRGDMRYFIQ